MTKNKKPDKTDPEQLGQYKAGRYELIPLHRWDHADRVAGKRRERGKTPTDKDWRRRDYRGFDAAAHMGRGLNVGVRLRTTDLVLDADPRNYDAGDDPLKRLLKDVGLGDGSSLPRVDTGSGGAHLYMTRPEGSSTLETLPAYKGLEFKTAGRQVVSAGSVHPNGSPYAWSWEGADLADGAPPAPERLLAMLRRPALAQSSAAASGGEHEPEALAEMLAALDPTEFRDHAAWLELMMASHHATAGEGSEEFADWSTSDPEYADRRGEILRRWDSLHHEGTGKVTYRTLYKRLHERGRAAAIPPRTTPEQDFAGLADDPEEGARREAELEGDTGELPPLERMNRDWWAVNDGGKFRLYSQHEEEFRDPDGTRRSRHYWDKMARKDFEDFHCNLMIEVSKPDGESEVKPLAPTWLRWAKRRTAKGVVFDPERQRPGYLNLWSGWAERPEPGDWSLLRDLIEGPLSGGDPAVARYVLDWCAHMFQRPGRPAEVALVFRGKKGVGKGTLGRTLTQLCGRHGLHATSQSHVTGRFNLHLRDCVCLFADEAFWAGDKAHEGTLKGLVTEDTLIYEGKGRDSESGPNLVHVVMASNEAWVAPTTSGDERRFMISDVTEERRGDKAFFDALNRQLDRGGRAAFLHDMLTRDLKGWHPRDSVPHTDAAAEQALLSMSGEEAWLLDTVHRGASPWGQWACAGDWDKGEVWAFSEELYADFCAKQRARGVARVATPTGFGLALKGLLGGAHGKRRIRVPDGSMVAAAKSDGRAWATRLPARRELEKRYERELAAMRKGGEW